MNPRMAGVGERGIDDIMREWREGLGGSPTRLYPHRVSRPVASGPPSVALPGSPPMLMSPNFALRAAHARARPRERS